MRLRPLLLASCALALSVPSIARAADYVDSVDAFSVHVDPPGFIACTTYPVERWDKVDCDGLSKDFESMMRAQMGRDAVLIGSDVFREDTWGFRVLVTRIPESVHKWNDAEEAGAVEGVRAAIVAQAAEQKLVVAPAGVNARMVSLGDERIVRIAYDTLGDAPTSVVELMVLGESTTYDVQFIGESTHARELAAIVDRVVQTVHVRPAARRPPLLPSVAAVALGFFALAGTVALLGVLAQARRKGRASQISWPSTRGNDRPDEP